MEKLFHQFQLVNLYDWLKLSKTQITENGGRSLLKLYSNNIEQLLTSTYPNYPWKFEKSKLFKKININSKQYFENITNQQQFMDQLFINLNLKTLDDWKFIANRTLFNVTKGKPLLDYYSNNINNLLSSIYPNYPWNFSSKGDLSSIETQRALMDQLLIKFNLSSLNDWLLVPKKSFRNEKSLRKILRKYYNNNFKQFLFTIYPNQMWDFVNFGHYRLKEKQEKLMEKLFVRFQLVYLEDWLNIPRKMIHQHGGRTLLKRYYSNNFNTLLSSIYPNYPWNFSFKRNEIRRDLSSIENQRALMDQLFIKLNLSSLNDWLSVPHQFLIKEARSLLHQYNYDMRRLLSTIYSDHLWNFVVSKLNSKIKIESPEQFMDRLFKHFQLVNLDDWLNVYRNTIISNGGRKLLKFYSNNTQKLLSSIYPNYPWNFEKNQKEKTRQKKFEYYELISNQRALMDRLFDELQLESLDDWSKISAMILINADLPMNLSFTTLSTPPQGDLKLILKKYYSNNFNNMLTNLYPNHNWNFEQYLQELIECDAHQYFQSIKNQRIFMNHIFIKLNFKSLDDWLKISFKPSNQSPKSNQSKLIDINNILQLYSNNFMQLLCSVYPLHKWDFKNFKFRPHRVLFKSSIEFNIKDKLISLKQQYLIEQKKDWYRLPTMIDQINVYESLKIAYPLERWSKSKFSNRTKKVRQRLLYCMICNYFSSSLVIESYYHPQLLFINDMTKMELDIFIPSLNIAFEYQGEHHYDDLPAMSSYLEHQIHRDQMKAQLSNQLQIKIVSIPYWWDQSLNSMLHAINLSK